MSLIEALLIVMVALGVAVTALVAAHVARASEREWQRGERHRLKSEVAALRAMLRQHGIDFPPIEPDEDEMRARR